LGRYQKGNLSIHIEAKDRILYLVEERTRLEKNMLVRVWETKYRDVEWLQFQQWGKDDLDQFLEVERDLKAPSCIDDVGREGLPVLRDCREGPCLHSIQVFSLGQNWPNGWIH